MNVGEENANEGPVATVCAVPAASTQKPKMEDTRSLLRMAPQSLRLVFWTDPPQHLLPADLLRFLGAT